MTFIAPEWPTPHNIKSLITTRTGGVSQGRYRGLNVADHVGDHPTHVKANRQALLDKVGHPVPWLHQVHGIEVVMLDKEKMHSGNRQYAADAVTTRTAGVVCAVQTADCLPLLICDREGSQVAAVHAGWRGLAAGIIRATLNQFSVSPPELMVYLGPAISQLHFQVGEEVVEAFLQSERRKSLAEPVSLAFKKDPQEEGRYLADLYRLAISELNGQGVNAIFGGNYCTYAQSKRFYSFRRDGVTGRMASLIWLVNGN